ncbi:hypothetical protein GCM10007897_24060 [Sphingobium jiangsuense]|uniref:DUF3325 domain-containing protein n=1 Tax=Sphingobium jiangsuense TaxID=870476 RepID=A0A7W6FS14_9SPHN|nr:DUF3325 domain-containing protein [Sphingobium jiangsuense]MBB3928620.1 hypothetical protein [Sphingobium jiangsuense]GLT01015.1 hypothetical protein GCM10007897_24060 [Sphingobium jiangsuense]
MMPLQPFWWDMLLLAFSIAGFALLALSRPREAQIVLKWPLSSQRQSAFRIAGWLFLGLALASSILAWRLNFGPFLWIGWMMLAVPAVAFAITYWPWRPKRLHRATNFASAVPVLSGPLRVFWQGLLTLALIAIPAGLVWAVHEAPIHPLLRDDAVAGKVGPWTFTMVEEERGPPETIGEDVVAKHVMLRFCDACDEQIRSAYLKVRKPRLPLAIGMEFEGARSAREVTLVIPPGIELADGIWLTAIGTDGSVHIAEIPLSQLMPATARQISEQAR